MARYVGNQIWGSLEKINTGSLTYRWTLFSKMSCTNIYEHCIISHVEIVPAKLSTESGAAEAKHISKSVKFSGPRPGLSAFCSSLLEARFLITL